MDVVAKRSNQIFKRNLMHEIENFEFFLPGIDREVSKLLFIRIRKENYQTIEKNVGIVV